MSRSSGESQKVLTFQRVQKNKAVFLKDGVMEKLGVEIGDWVSVWEGPEPGSIIVKFAAKGDVDLD